MISIHRHSQRDLRSGDALHPCGFTLLELLVAMTVTAFILVILLILFHQVVTAWNQESTRESNRREARSGLRLLVDDLQNLYALPEPARHPLATAHSQKIQRFILLPPTGGDASDQSSAFAFLRTISPQSRSTNPENMDVVLVLYRAAFNTNPNGKNNLMLLRRQLSPVETLERLQKHLEEGKPLVGNEDWSSMSHPSTAKDDPVVYDLIRCVVTPLEHQESTSLPVSQPWPEDQIPSRLEITLSVTNPIHAAQLVTPRDWTNEVINLATQGSLHPEILTYALRIRLHAKQPPNVSLSTP